MVKPRRQIFRESAMRQYIQRREQDVLPQLVSPPVFASSWFLLALILTAALLAWSAQLPTFVSAPGVIIQQTQLPSSTKTKPANMAALIFFPPSNASQLHTGQLVTLQFSVTGQRITSTITQIEAGPISPGDARKAYGLDASEGQVITEPSTIVIMNLDVGASTHLNGSIITAQVQVGTHSVLSQIT
jgi:hypothetical protein